MKASLLIFSALIILSTFHTVGSVQSKPATISLKAKWNSTSVLLEAVQFLAEEDPKLAWQFIEDWHSRQSEQTDHCWNKIIDNAGALLTPGMSKVLQVALGIRQYSPRLELLRIAGLEAGADEETCAFVDFGKASARNLKELGALLEQQDEQYTNAATVHPFDIIFPAQDSADTLPTTAVLYGAVGTEAFWEIHKVLAKAAADGLPGKRSLRYIYRPVLLPGCPRQSIDQCLVLGTGDKLQLPGFGVGMAIKNMEYSALDEKKVAAEKAAATGSGDQDPGLAEELNGFDFRRLIERHLEKTKELLEFRDHLLASSSAEESLKVWDLKDLGLQATQRIASASDPLRSLTDISQNFPNLAAVLSRSNVDERVREELSANQQLLPGGATFMLLNGMFLDPEVDIYELLKRIRKEVRLAERLSESRLGGMELTALLGMRAFVEPQDSQDLRLDLTSGGQVVFLNDLERDGQYRNWAWSLTEMLRPMFPGTLPRIGRNVFSLVAIIDPGSVQGIKTARYAYELAAGAQYPIRVGILLAPQQMLDRINARGIDTAAETAWQDLSPGERAAGLFSILLQQEGALEAVSFLASVADASSGNDLLDSSTDVTWQQIEAAFDRALQRLGGLEGGETSAESVKEGASRSVGTTVVAQAAAVANAGLSSRGNSLWLNGAALPEAAPSLQAKLGYGVQQELQRIQELVYFGTLSDTEDDILGFLMTHYKAVPRYNPRIVGADEGEPAKQLPLVAQLAPSSGILASLGYLHHPGTEDAVKTVTHWVAADLDTQAGRHLLGEALKYLQSPESASSRVGILQRGSPDSSFSKAVAAAVQLPARRSKIPGFLTRLLDALGDTDDLAQEVVLELAEQAGLNRKALNALLDNSDNISEQITGQAAVCRDALGLPSESAAVITNGRILLAHSPSQNVTDGIFAADFLLLDHHAATAQLARPVSAVLEEALSSGRSPLPPLLSKDEEGAVEADLEATVEQLSDAALVASSVLAHDLAIDPYRVQGQVVKVIQALDVMQKQHTGISLPGDGKGLLQVTAVLDPLSKTAQQLSAILDFLQATLQPSIQVHLNPKSDLSTLPLTSFYRLALPQYPPRAGGGLGMPEPPVAVFAGLPLTKVLTLHMDVPDSWLVEPVRAAHDLDNLRLIELGAEGALSVEFELEALLLTGSCTDDTAKRRELVTPRGVQLHLGTSKQPHLVDTLVMSNLGYYQLKASPGVFHLRLAPGRSQLLYSVLPSEPSTALLEEHEDQIQIPIVIDSLQGKKQRLRLRKRKGYEMEDVLEDPDKGASGGLMQSVSSWFGSSKTSKEPTAGDTRSLTPEDDPDTIHIFTIASGHMYERLQKIMILSLIRNTRSRVKVWFIKNYMSPQMKKFLPHMAAHYGFDFEFVTYKWPSWLHKQTDKQRIIWAYKILFLDVLFPLNLRKVIFVDSDQIMRADFSELWKMDLKGAPLAYTPFCDNNKDMDGFRFWKQGFWRDHLRGQPYHISALYVVDLVKFRQMAAGDQLRIVYEQLSKDPNSLSNLDQDLPNYAQHSVPIYSLPQEWLWCETWCGNETKTAAKTIDLCNNPLTKEPKLQGARRIVAEWPALDAEAQDFTAQVQDRLSRQAIESGGVFEEGELSLSSSTQEEALAAQNEPTGSREGVKHGNEDQGKTAVNDHIEL